MEGANFREAKNSVYTIIRFGRDRVFSLGNPTLAGEVRKLQIIPSQVQKLRRVLSAELAIS